MTALRDHLSKLALRMRSRLTMRSMISNSEWTAIADEIDHLAAQPAPPALSPLPPGWNFQRGGEGVIHVMGPEGLAVVRRDSTRIPEVVLYQLADALLSDQDRLPVSGPMTAAEVRQWMAGCSEPLARETLRHYLDLASQNRPSAAAA